MKLDRVMIAAPKSGSGKTTITCALLQALKDMGQKVAAYKCGPDYIDPMFHQKVIGIPSKNLDTFFTGGEDTKRLFLRDRTEGELAVLEGVMGLYDGLGGIREEGSSYDLARTTRTPIILVVDAKGMGRSVIALIAGFLAYDKEHLVKGVILNRMSGTYYQTVKPLIEEELDIHVMGYLPEDGRFHIQSRHLGLRMPDELADIQMRLQAVAEDLKKTVSVEQIIQLAAEAGELEGEEKKACMHGSRYRKERPVIAVARDEAFCFYYEDNLSMLQEYGANIENFSPLHDTRLPNGCSGLLIGGGYPELYAEELSSNVEMLEKIRKAIGDGMPTVAECGGFMYLHAQIRDKEGRAYAMAGVVPAECHFAGRLVRFGYIEIEEKQNHFLAEGTGIRGHEFHYFDSDSNGTGCVAVKPATGRPYPCVMVGEDYWMGFPHLYYPSNPSFVQNFVDKASHFASERYG